MITSVDFWPRLRAESQVFAPYQAVISITDPGQANANIAGTTDVLRLQFLDIEAPVNHPRFKPESLFNEEHAAAIAEFVAKVHAEPWNRQVIVHCEAGISRSAGVALFVEAATDCEFQTRSRAGSGNKRVVSLLSMRLPEPIVMPEYSYIADVW